MLFFACVIAASGRIQRAPALSSGWTIDTGRPIHLNTSVSFEIAVAETSIDVLRQIAIEVSTPGSLKYGAHLNVSEIEAITAPKKKDLEYLLAWLSTEQRATFNVRHGRSIDVTAPIETAERLLRAKFEVVASVNQPDE